MSVKNSFSYIYIQIDEERHRVSLGMKKSYFDSDLTDGTNDDDNERVPMDISHIPEIARDLNRALVLPEPESRASVLPLQVSLDESECSDQEDGNKGHEIANGTEANAKKSEKRLIEKTRKQRFPDILFFLYLLVPST